MSRCGVGEGDIVFVIGVMFHQRVGQSAVGFKRKQRLGELPAADAKKIRFDGGA